MSDKLNVEPMKLHAERVLAQHADWDAGLRQSEMDVLKLAIMSKDLAADVTALLAALAERDAEVARLRVALASVRQTHVTCEDPWYSCPKCPEGSLRDNDGECNCGADAANAIIEAALRGQA